MRTDKATGVISISMVLLVAPLAQRIAAQTSPSEPLRERKAAESRQAHAGLQMPLRQERDHLISAKPTRSVFDTSPELGQSPANPGFATPPAVSSTGMIGRSATGQVGQRQSLDAPAGFNNPLARINGRIATRIQSRVDSRFNPADAPRSSQDAIAAAADQARSTSISPR